MFTRVQYGVSPCHQQSTVVAIKSAMQPDTASGELSVAGASGSSSRSAHASATSNRSKQPAKKLTKKRKVCC